MKNQILYLCKGLFLKDLLFYMIFERRLYNELRSRLEGLAIQQAHQRGLLTPIEFIDRFEIQKKLESELKAIAARFKLAKDQPSSIVNAVHYLLDNYPPELAAFMLSFALDPLPPYGGRLDQELVSALMETMENMDQIDPTLSERAAEVIVRTFCLDRYRPPFALFKRIVHFLPLEDERHLPMARLVADKLFKLDPRVAAVLWQKLSPSTQAFLKGGKAKGGRYYNSIYHFSIECPNGWKIDMSDPNPELLILFRGPRDNPAINIIAGPTDLPPEWRTFETLIRIAEDGISKSGAQPIGKLKEIYINGADVAIEAAYILGLNRFKKIIFFRGDDEYYISCTAKLEVYDEYKPVFDECIRSLQFLQPRPVRKRASTQDGRVHYEQGHYYFDKGRYTEAIKEFSKALEEGVSDVPDYYLYVYRGRCRLLLEDSEGRRAGQEDVKKAIQLGMEPGKAYLTVGNAFSLHGISQNDGQSLEMALSYYQRAEREGERTEELYHNRYQVLARLGEYVEADEDLIKEARVRRGRDPDERWWGNQEVFRDG